MPGSTMKTCGQSHDTDFIQKHAFHPDLGLSTSFEQRYGKLSFTRTESIPQLNADPIVETHVYSADQMLEKRLVQIAPAELFKTVYNQSINLIMLDVRS